jgi:hypothetical protein
MDDGSDRWWLEPQADGSGELCCVAVLAFGVLTFRLPPRHSFREGSEPKRESARAASGKRHGREGSVLSWFSTA